MKILNKLFNEYRTIFLASTFAVFILGMLLLLMPESIIVNSNFYTKFIDIFIVPIEESRNQLINEIRVVMMISNPLVIFASFFIATNYYMHIGAEVMNRRYNTDFIRKFIRPYTIVERVLFRMILIISLSSTFLVFLPEIIIYLQSFSFYK